MVELGAVHVALGVVDDGAAVELAVEAVVLGEPVAEREGEHRPEGVLAELVELARDETAEVEDHCLFCLSLCLCFWVVFAAKKR